ncbi:hypothetical protein PMAYCL1PPCAC_07478, partial [Pristionchus mayeri]
FPPSEVMRKTRWALLQLMMIPSILGDTSGHLYCPLDAPNRYFGNVGSWSLNFDEYPTPLSSGSLNQKIDACTELGSRSDKLQAGVAKEGSFASLHCTPRCAFTLAMGDSLECAERRLPMQWSASFILPSRKTTKVDCSNISLPYTIDKYPENRVILQVLGSGKYPEDFLSTINSLPVAIDLLHFSLSDQYSMSTYSTIALNISKKMESISKIAITSEQTLNIDPTDLLSSLTNFPDIKEFSMNSITNISTLPDFLENKSKLISLRLENNGLINFPSWAMNLENLQFLKVQDYGMDPSFLSQLNLPSLEHFIMIGNNFSVLPSNFLSTSKQLIQLDLSCNLIQTLPSSLSHLSNLKFLYLAGNLFLTLPPTLLPSFPRLLSLDVARFVSGLTFEIGSSEFICRSFPVDELAANHPGIESFNKSHLSNAKNLKVLNLNGNIELAKLGEGLFELTPKIKSISMRRIGFPSLSGLGLCGLCHLESLEVSYNQFQSSSWIEEECGLGWPTISYIGLAFVNLTSSTPALALMALSSETMYSKIEYFFYTNPIFNNTCELANFYSMIEGVPSWRFTPECLDSANQRIAQIASLRNEKYALRPCSDGVSSILTLSLPLLILITVM